MADHFEDFPYEDIRQKDGNLFDTLDQAKGAGYAENQIWSVVVDDDSNTWTYGPAHHYINRMGFVATVETHDGDTYYHETWDPEEMEEDPEDAYLS